MYQDERLIQIKAYLKEHKRISVNQLMEFFDISRDTARRDLVKLEEDRDVIRTRGGAKWSSADPTITLSERKIEIEMPASSIQSIASYASSLVNEADSLLLDGSITVKSLATNLNVAQLKVITNSIALIDTLPKVVSLQVHLLCGLLNRQKQSLYGSSLIDHLEQYNVEKVFLGAAGLTQDGIYYDDEEEALVQRAMAKRGKQIIVLIEESAFGNSGFCRGISFNDVDIVITNKDPGKEYERLFNQQNVELIVTSRNQ